MNPLFFSNNYSITFIRLFICQMKIYFFLIFGLLSISLLGQESVEAFKVYGVVKESDRHMTLLFVTVRIQDMTTIVVIGDVTYKEGQFELSVPEGK